MDPKHWLKWKHLQVKKCDLYIFVNYQFKRKISKNVCLFDNVKKVLTVI